MKYRFADDKKIARYMISAGKTFLAIRFEDLLSHAEQLDNASSRNKIIEEYYKNQKGTTDRDIKGTRTRVNAASYIIQANKVRFALAEIINSTSHMVTEEHKNMARMILKKIDNGEITLPKLIE